jgi:hypothetical protein
MNEHSLSKGFSKFGMIGSITRKLDSVSFGSHLLSLRILNLLSSLKNITLLDANKSTNHLTSKTDISHKNPCRDNLRYSFKIQYRTMNYKSSRERLNVGSKMLKLNTMNSLELRVVKVKVGNKMQMGRN